MRVAEGSLAAKESPVVHTLESDAHTATVARKIFDNSEDI